MKKGLFFFLAFLFSFPAHAQLINGRILSGGCGTGGYGTGTAPITMDQNGNLCSSANGPPAVSLSAYNSTAAESNHVVQASKTSLYRIYAYSTAAGLLMTFNSTTVPADGAVTPIECIPVSANNFAAHEMGTIPDSYATGLSIAFSSGTNCFNKAASSTAMFKVGYQ